MTYNDTSKKATMKYINNNLDTVSFRLPKEKKDQRPTKKEITEHAKSHNYQSVQAFILHAINSQMMIDNKQAAFVDLTDC